MRVMPAIDCLVRESRSGPRSWSQPRPGATAAGVYNAAIVIDRGTIAPRFKSDLPNYGVFDEKRCSRPGPMPDPISFPRRHDRRAGCAKTSGHPRSPRIWRVLGAELFLVPNGSPFEAGKFSTRLELARARARETNRALAYVNQVGGQDELVFDGRSFAVDSRGKPGALAGRLGRIGRDDALAKDSRWLVL
jgi:NAD+ synthase